MTSAADVLEVKEAPPIQNVKILVCGDVAGQFDRLFKKVASLNAKSGPFDMLLCVGNFFDNPKGVHLADETKAIAQHQLAEYIEGFKSVPIPTYFIAGPDEEKLLPGTREQFCPNLSYLGKFGIAQLKGLSVAYVSGKFGKNEDECSSFLKNDFESLVATWATDVGKGVDVLLTNEWAEDILSNIPTSQQPKAPNGRPFDKVGSAMVSMTARSLRPRYHFCGTEEQFYLRAPYVNRESVTDFGQRHVTRFVALAKCYNPEKLKYLYAINVTPIKLMDDKALFEKPADATDSPFVAALAAKDVAAREAHAKRYSGSDQPTKKARLNDGGIRTTGFVRSGAQQSRQQAVLAPSGGFNRFGNQNSGLLGAGPSNQRGRNNNRNNRKPLPPVGDCWFCLKSPKVEKHLIVSIASDAYVALAKGGLVDEHLLIVAVEHALNYDEMSDDSKAQIDKYKQSIVHYYAKTNREPVFWERFLIVRNMCHMHIQAVPIAKGSSTRAKEAFKSFAEQRQYKFEPVSQSAGSPYFRVEFGDGTILMHHINTNKRFDLQFGRRVCAELLSMPERVDWKKCTPSTAEEKTIAKRIRKDFATVDWSLAEEDEY